MKGKKEKAATTSTSAVSAGEGAEDGPGKTKKKKKEKPADTVAEEGAKRPKKATPLAPTPPSSSVPKWVLPADPALDQSLAMMTEDGAKTTTLRKTKPAASLDLSAKSAVAVLTGLGFTDIFHLDLFGRANITKEIIIATGSSNPQLVAGCDQILSLVPKTAKKKGILLALGAEKELKVRPRQEGRGHNNGWIVVDCVTFMVHLFTREQREFYDLEGLYYLESRVGEGEDGWDWSVEKLPKHKVHASTGFVEERLKRGIIRDDTDSESEAEGARGKRRQKKGMGRRARKVHDHSDDPEDDEVSMPKPKALKKGNKYLIRKVE